jgi:phenylacetate-CoA ligase
VWPAPVGGMQATTLAVLHELEHSQYLPPEELKARQYRQLGFLVAHAAKRMKFWRERFSAAGFDPAAPIDDETWARLPILSRAEAQEAGAALHCSTLPKQHGETTTDKTSGSTGVPLIVKRSAITLFYWNVFTLREEMWHARDFSGKLAAIRADFSRPHGDAGRWVRSLPNWGPPVAAHYPTGPSALFDIRSSTDDQIAWLQDFAPDYLLSFGLNLQILARHCLAHGITLPTLKGVRSSGEVLSDEARAACRQAWGVEVADMYSAVETGYLAIQCPEAGRLHAQSESALIEVLNDEGRPCAPGEIGRVVVTPLHNFAMPLIRYAIGDLAEVGDACACRRTLPALARVLGRVRDAVTLPDGTRRYPYYGNKAIAEIPAIVQHQLVQKSRDAIEVRLVARAPLSAAQEDGLRRALATALGHPFDVAIVYVDAIERSLSGKFVEFLSEL